MLARRHIFRAHFWQTSSNYVQQASGLLLSILLARLLTPADFGQFAYAAAVLGLFILPASWSLAPQVVAEIRTNPEIVSDAIHYVRLLLPARIFLSFAACCFLLFTGSISQAGIALLLAVPIAGQDFLTVLRATTEGRGEFKLNFWDSLVAGSIAGCISLPAAYFGCGAWAIVAPAIPLFLVQWVLFTRITGIGFRPTVPLSSRSYFKAATSLWLAGCSDTALNRSDKFLLGRFSTMEALGDYNRAFNFTPLAARALSSLITNPTVASLTRTHDGLARRKLLLKSGALLAFGGVANFIVWWFFSDPLVPMIFGEQWATAIPVFQAMAPLSLAMSIAYLPATSAVADRAYTALAVVRSVTFVAFIGTVIGFSSQMSAVAMAWLFQAALVAQGIMILIARGSRLWRS